MPTIIFIESDGTRREVEIDSGYTIMEAATINGVEGIEAECGGACACATCHAYVDEAWSERLPAMQDLEDAMLETADARRAASRLTCQIEVTDEMDGLILTVAK